MSAPLRLNPLQVSSVQHRGSNLVIEAGAGTGKTETLAHRAASLLQDGDFRPHQLWMCSYTRSAAKNLRERVKSMSYHGQFVTCGTLHSLALRLIRAHGWRYDIASDVLDNASRLSLIRIFAKELGIPATMKASEISQLLSLSINTGVDLEQHCRNAGLARKLTALDSLMVDYMRDHHLIDYDSIIYEARELVEQHGDWIARHDCKHLIVDEVQDLSSLQLSLLHELSSKGVRITIAGDRMQVLYAWRGAFPESMQNFSNLADWTRLELRQNYRCPEPVLKVANTVSLSQGGVQLFSGIKGPEVVHQCYKSDTEEANAVSAQIYEQIEQGTNPADIAVLFRSTLHCLQLQESLRLLEVPYIKHGGLRSQRTTLQHLLSLLRLSVGDHQFSLLRILQLCPGIGEATARKILEGGKVPTKSLDRYESLMATIQGMRISDLETIWELATDWLSVVADLSGLDEIAESFHASDSVRAFLDDQALDFAAEDEQAKPAVHLGTVHWAKGKEFPYVYVIGASYGRLVRLGEPEDERLQFVAYTRTQKQLVISSSSMFFDGKKIVQSIPCVEV